MVDALDDSGILANKVPDHSNVRVSKLDPLGTMATLCQLFADSVRRSPDAIAIHHRSQDCTYADLWRESTSIAEWLRAHDLRRGDRVAILLPNCADYVSTYFGILLAGGIAVGLNPDCTPRELISTVRHSGAVGIVFPPNGEKLVRDAANELGDHARLLLRTEAIQGEASYGGKVAHSIPQVLREFSGQSIRDTSTENDVAQLIYTSGTTGRPKGVTLSHRNLVANCRSIVKYLELSSSDSVFVILPFFYSYGNSLLLTHIAVGGRLILASDFVFWNRALDLMEQQHATGFSGVPSSYAMLLHKSNFAQRKWASLRYLTCAGGGLAPAVAQQLKAIVPSARLFLMYGQTEGAARLSTLMPEDLERKLGSIGKGIPGVTISVVDESGQPVTGNAVGEIVAQGDNIMSGYWNDREETDRVLKPDGLHTGDLARVDEDGFVFIVGRSSDIIKSGAYRINPKELEEIILELPGVAEVAVAGAPDPVLGEFPVAFLVPAPNRVLTESEILNHCQRNLPRYKWIRAVHFVEALPKTSSGKVKRAELREWTAGPKSSGQPATDTGPTNDTLEREVSVPE